MNKIWGVPVHGMLIHIRGKGSRTTLINLIGQDWDERDGGKKEGPFVCYLLERVSTGGSGTDL